MPTTFKGKYRDKKDLWSSTLYFYQVHSSTKALWRLELLGTKHKHMHDQNKVHILHVSFFGSTRRARYSVLNGMSLLFLYTFFEFFATQKKKPTKF